MIEPADRLKKLPAYVFTTIGQQIRALEGQGHKVIRLDAGVPDGMPPFPVMQTLTKVAQQPHVHGYSGEAGSRKLRRAIAGYYDRRFQVKLDPNTQILPLLGSKEGLVNLSLAYLNPGDKAFIPDPSYPAYSRGVALADGEACPMPLTPDNNFLPDLQAISQVDANRARMLWINYPNNPTGAVADLSYYQEVVDFCIAHNILLVSDNPYVELTFDGFQAGSVLQATDALHCCVEFMTFSKSFNMAGWRLGAAVGNPATIKLLSQLKRTIDAGHFIPIYEAGVTALEQTPDDWRHGHRQVYQQRRDWVLDALPTIGLSAHKPQGSMFVWAEVNEGNGLRYAQEALEHAHVSLTPGETFGFSSKRFVRISLGMRDDQLQLALDRLKDWHSAR